MEPETTKEQKLIGYARVSTVAQREDRQLLALMEMGVQKKNIYVDKMTGKDFVRPRYLEMLENLSENTVLVIKSIDRLGRSYHDLSEQWRIITKEKKADIVVLDMPILDTRKEKNLLGTFISDLILSLLSYCAANEFNVIHQRQAEGIAAAKARGVTFGRPSNPLPENFVKVCREWERGKISGAQAAEKCNMPVSSFKYQAKLCQNAKKSKKKRRGEAGNVQNTDARKKQG